MNFWRCGAQTEGGHWREGADTGTAIAVVNLCSLGLFSIDGFLLMCVSNAGLVAEGAQVRVHGPLAGRVPAARSVADRSSNRDYLGTLRREVGEVCGQRSRAAEQ